MNGAATPPSVGRLLQAMEATWPAAACHPDGPFTLREGNGGGKRVSAATACGPVTAADIAGAEAGMRALGQPPLFLVRGGDARLDAQLAAAGYHLIDPVVLYCAATALLADPVPPPLATFALWPPLAITEAIWADAGIGAARLAVMERVTGPKTSFLARALSRSAGAAFVACDGDIAMLHALEVVPGLRRHKTASNILRSAAAWALDQGAVWLGVAVTVANVPAGNLYTSLGMSVVGHYHYRQG